MSSLALAFLFSKVMKTKSLRYLSILKATKSSQPAAIRLAAFGRWTQAMRFKFSRVTRMKYSLAHSIMKEILSLLDQKTTHAASGRINMHSRASRSRRQQRHPLIERPNHESLCNLS